MFILFDLSCQPEASWAKETLISKPGGNHRVLHHLEFELKNMRSSALLNMICVSNAFSFVFFPWIYWNHDMFRHEGGSPTNASEAETGPRHCAMLDELVLFQAAAASVFDMSAMNYSGINKWSYTSAEKQPRNAKGVRGLTMCLGCSHPNCGRLAVWDAFIKSSNVKPPKALRGTCCHWICNHSHRDLAANDPLNHWMKISGPISKGIKLRKEYLF